MNGVIGQRLVRTLCSKCREPYRASDELIERMQLRRFGGDGEIKLYHAKGCDECAGGGYTGRVGIYEFLGVDEEMRGLVLKRTDSANLHRAAKAQGMMTMSEDGIRKAISGITSIEEVLRVTRQN